jgi:hypothetical protein
MHSVFAQLAIVLDLTFSLWGQPECLFKQQDLLQCQHLQLSSLIILVTELLTDQVPHYRL